MDNKLNYGLAVVGIVSLVGSPAFAGTPQANTPTEIGIQDVAYYKFETGNPTSYYISTGSYKTSGYTSEPIAGSVTLRFVVDVNDPDGIREVYMNGDQVMHIEDYIIRDEVLKSWSMLHAETLPPNSLADYSVSVRVVDMLGDEKEVNFFRVKQ